MNKVLKIIICLIVLVGSNTLTYKAGVHIGQQQVLDALTEVFGGHLDTSNTLVGN